MQGDGERERIVGHAKGEGGRRQDGISVSNVGSHGVVFNLVGAGGVRVNGELVVSSSVSVAVRGGLDVVALGSGNNGVVVCGSVVVDEQTLVRLVLPIVLRVGNKALVLVGREDLFCGMRSWRVSEG